MPKSCGVVLGDNVNSSASVAHYVSMCRTIYLTYENHGKYVP